MTQPYLLAIETSGRSASVALAKRCGEGKHDLLVDKTIDPADRTARVLIPAIRALLSTVGAAPTELAAIAVATGPGSFTGLRIGVTAAKTLAYATCAKLVGVNTLDLLAGQAILAEEGRVWAVLDAQRGDLFTAYYTAADLATLGELDRTRLIEAENWLAKLKPGDTVIGPVSGRYADQFPPGIRVADAERSTPRAATVAKLGFKLLDQGQFADPFQLVPQYHRLSAAEEKARNK